MLTRWAFKTDRLLGSSKIGLNFSSIVLQLAGASKVNGPVPRSRDLHCDGNFKGIARMQRFYIGYLKVEPSFGGWLIQDQRLDVPA